MSGYRNKLAEVIDRLEKSEPGSLDMGAGVKIRTSDILAEAGLDPFQVDVIGAVGVLDGLSMLSFVTNRMQEKFGTTSHKKDGDGFYWSGVRWKVENNPLN